jgi:hypothetical protein
VETIIERGVMGRSLIYKLSEKVAALKADDPCFRKLKNEILSSVYSEKHGGKYDLPPYGRFHFHAEERDTSGLVPMKGGDLVIRIWHELDHV